MKHAHFPLFVVLLSQVWHLPIADIETATLFVLMVNFAVVTEHVVVPECVHFHTCILEENKSTNKNEDEDFKHLLFSLWS